MDMDAFRVPLVFVYPFTMLTFVMVYAGSICFSRRKFPLIGFAGIVTYLRRIDFRHQARRPDEPNLGVAGR